MNTASTTSPALGRNSSTRPANFTRRTRDLTGKFRRKGQFHLIALYHILRLSDFAREGIEHSGSYRFADHLYRNVASGRGWFGRWLDRRLLELPSARAMRQRYVKAMVQIEGCLSRRAGPLRLLALPCGIPRDVSEFASADPAASGRIRYTAMDLDPEVLVAATEHLRDAPLGSREFVEGNALHLESYPQGRFDLVVSTGLGEFLDDEQLACFYRNVFASLDQAGTFFTSGTAFEPRSDHLMKAFEMEAHYRNRERLERILRLLPWNELSFEVHPSGLQTFVRAVK